MKKLLSLLSFLTISGATMPMAVAAAPCQQTNNLETLKRNKRENNEATPNSNLENNEKTPNINLENNEQDLTNLNTRNNNKIFKTPTLYVNWNANDYFDKLKKEILKSLLDKGIILNLNNSGRITYFAINAASNFDYFIIPISVERDGQSININLLFRLSDFYLQGFSYNTTFYHFSDSNIITIPGETSIDLNFNSDYGSLMGGVGSDPLISWAGIEQAFNDLVNFGENPASSGNTAIIRGALGRVILATAESMRFRQVRDNIVRTYNQNIQLSWASDFYPIITNWSSTTKEAISYLKEHENSLLDFSHNSNILIFTSLILTYLNICNTNLKYDATCYEQPPIDKIPGKITVLKILDEDTEGGNLKPGTMYVGTDNGVYIIYPDDQVHRFDNLDFPITSIKLDNNGSAYVTNNQEEVYHLNLIGWGSEKLEKVKSSNLEKEIKLYYDNDEKNIQFDFNPDPAGTNYLNTNFKTLKLGKINPLNFKKIEFLGDIDNDNWGTMVNWHTSSANIVYTNDGPASWGDVHKWILNGPSKSIETFLKENNNDFKNIIENTTNQISPEKEQILQKFTDEVKKEKEISINQRFGLTFYWKDDIYYLKVFALQYCEWWGSNWQFNCHIKIGNGVRLYS